MSSQHSLKVILIFLHITAIISLGLLNAVPPIARDSLIHHLAIPKLYLLHGGMYEIPDLIFSYYPMNLELLYLIALKIGIETLPKYIHLGFGLATSLLIYKLARQYLNDLLSLSASLFFLSTPIIIRLATSEYVDLGLTFFTTAAVFYILRWKHTNHVRFLIFAGIFAGAAAGTKYNGMLVIFLLTCFVPFLTPRNSINHRSPALLQCAIFLICALIIFSPWLIRNALWTGNPVFPLFRSLFGTGMTPITEGMNPLLIRNLSYNESILDFLTIPVKIFFQGRDDNPQYYDGVLNPFLMLFPFLLLLPNTNSEHRAHFIRVSLWFIILFISFTFVQRVIRIRYIVPILPLLILLAFLGLDQIRLFVQHRFRTISANAIAAFLLCCAFSYNVNYLFDYWKKLQPIDYISAKISRADYISRFWPEYPVIEYANTHLSPTAKIVAVFLGDRSYYFTRPVSFDVKGGVSIVCTLGKTMEKPSDIARTLSQSGFTHLLIRHDLFKTYCLDSATSNNREKLITFFKTQTTTIYSIPNYSLHALKVEDLRLDD